MPERGRPIDLDYTVFESSEGSVLQRHVVDDYEFPGPAFTDKEIAEQEKIAKQEGTE